MGNPEADPLAPWLTALVRLLAAEPRVVGLRLLGSAARGEAAGAWLDGAWQCFSDIEVLVVTDGRLPASRRREIARRARDLAGGWGQRSPAFHVDLLLRERSRLGKLPPFVFTHELREAGRTLYGPELRSEIRTVDRDNLDLRNTREILFKRLWHLAETLPSDWLRRRPLDEMAARGLAVSLARQALDLPTALLPESGVLVAGYAARQEAMAAVEPPFATALTPWLGGDPRAYLADCLERRRRAAPSVDLLADYRSTVAVLAGGLAWLMDRHAGNGAVSIAAAPNAAGDDRPGAAGDPLVGRLIVLAGILPDRSRRLFNERAVTPGEALALARQSVRLAYSLGPLAALRWCWSPRKGCLAAGLLRLHGAGLRLMDGHSADAAALLADARRDLLRAHGDWPPADAPPLPADPVEAWLAVRREAGRAFWSVARLGAPAAWRDIETRLV